MKDKKVKLQFVSQTLDVTKCYIISYFDVIDSSKGDKVGYIRYSTNYEGKTLFIHNIEMYKKREGYGTATINTLRKYYKDYWAIGDILYPLAWEFWRTLDTRLNACKGDEPDLWFEFVL